ncbi:hypothetical protein BU26DRAFT_515534 [Trematosphaeria pertusa]|uniref:C2H2-type domain-containing protein n=1 Tax=Trematosphaeria pertusa TaxID=390896 RepID=A0A6A6IST7_9PLEO|nr:uncharacterized protein BU26DRAFT_515534 [Trematosphaeria pertusa]KAF2253157.1 hypothetical protein BU26DRAFT_515534 [Trematosphaeria pertusa]
MEPPAKRLRILQSVEVDESNPDYIAAKEKEKARLKSRFESIFSKFEAIPAAMSDEISMRTGEIVVDRGHYRRLNREYKQRHGRRATQLLDDLMADELPEVSDEEDGSGEDAKDELAPSQSPEPRNRKQEEDDDGQAGTTALQCHRLVHLPPSDTPMSMHPQRHPQPIVANPASHAVDLTQLVQFPQTPAGQQAQTAFVAQITQAVQQAVTPIVSNLLANGVNFQLPASNDLPGPITPALAGGKIAPFTDPNSFSPALSATGSRHVHPYSSPISVSIRRPKPRSFSSRNAPIEPIPRKCIEDEAATTTETPISSPIPELSKERDAHERADIASVDQSQAKPRARSTQKRRGKYLFTEADDAYIVEQRRVHNTPWKEIKASRAKWRDWPTTSLCNRWQFHLKSKECPAHGSIVDAESDERAPEGKDTQYNDLTSGPRETGTQKLKFPSVKSLESLTTSPHLPTPSSLENHDADDAHEEQPHIVAQNIENMLASGAHFDDDERELLSLAGADEPVEGTPIGGGSGEFEDPTYFPAADEAILPSVETETPPEGDAKAEADFPVDEDAQNKRPFTLPIVEHETSIPTETVTPARQNLAGAFSTSAKKRKPRPKLINFQVGSESEDDLDLIDVDSSFICNTCQKPFRTSKALERHQWNPNIMHSGVDLAANSASSSLAEPVPTQDDELLAPATPAIKRESLTPPRNLLSAPAFRTPRSAPQPSALQSSGGPSASKLGRSAFLKKVKQSWAKNGRKSAIAPKTLTKRSSFHTVPRKRAWEAEEDSADDLAL